MELAKQFKEYALDNQKDLYQFFSGLTKKQQKSLKKTMILVKALLKKQGGNKKVLDTDITKKEQLELCAMQVFSRNQFYEHWKKIPDCYFNKGYHQDFRPKWLESEINAKEPWQGLRYNSIANFPTYNDCNILPVTFAEKLSWEVVFWNQKKREIEVHFDFLDEHAVTLDTHIWYLFTEESSINAVDSYNDGVWKQAFTYLIEQNRIDRFRVLQSCLHTANLNFRQQHTSWFFDLFESLKPTIDELNELQPELIQALQCQYSKVVKTALSNLKTCYKYTPDNFLIERFINASASPLSSDVKSVVTATIILYNDIAKTAKKTNNSNTLMALNQQIVNALLFADETVQTRVAKFLVSYHVTEDITGNEAYEELQQLIDDYSVNAFSSVKTMLSPLCNHTESETESDKKPDNQKVINRYQYLIDDSNRIQIPDTNFDDLLFSLASAFEKYSAYSTDIAMQTMIELARITDNSNIAKLEPLLKKAFDSHALIHKYFIRLMYILLQRHTNHPTFTLASASTLNKDFEYFHTFDERDVVLFHGELSLYDINRHALHIIEHQLPVPMLSTPTHKPCYIDGFTLVDRLASYQHHDVAVNRVDFQVALARCVFDNNDDNLVQKITDSLQGELAEVLLFLVQDNHTLTLEHAKTDYMWLMAGYLNYLRNEKTNADDFNAMKAHFSQALGFLDQPLQWQLQETVNKEFDYSDFQTRVELQNQHLNQVKKSQAHPLFLNYFDTHDALDRVSPQLIWEPVIQRLMTLLPENPKWVVVPIIREVLFKRSFTHHAFIFRPALVKALQVLVDTWQTSQPDEVYAFLAMCLLDEKKLNRQTAGELWLKHVSHTDMDNAKLGKHLATLENMNFAPVKRFTDLLTQQLMNVSNVHNQALITLISNMIPNMNDEPIKGTKKLLELYLELLTITKTALPNLVNDKLTIWAETKSLKAIIKKLNSL